MLLTIAIKATLVLGFAFGAAVALRRASAATRHVMWTCALLCVASLPLIELSAPQWRVALPHAAANVVLVMADHAPPVRVTAPRRFGLTLVWYAGIALAFARLLTGCARLRRIVAQAKPAAWLPAEGRARILESTGITVPITCGVLRPAILFPASAREWPHERLRVVLAHELAHVRRFDWLTQMAAEVTCAVFWFHPLVWLAASQFRQERERACDDAVLNHGTRSSDYAEHLLGVIKSAHRKGSIAMAISIHSNDFQARLKAVLKPDVNRKAASLKMAAIAAAAALCIVVPIATMRAQAPGTTAAMAGSVLDISGAVIPGATITASGLDTHNKEVAYSRADGTYSFRALPPGRYLVEVRSRGFTLFQKQVQVTAGEPLPLDATLEMGGINENISVLGEKPPSTAAAPRAVPQTVRVGGHVQATKLAYRVPPVYPQHAKQNGIQGVVVLQAVIGTNGNLLSIETLSKSVDPELVQSARDAVGQWRYEPVLLNGQPVEAVTTITVNFQLE